MSPRRGETLASNLDPAVRAKYFRHLTNIARVERSPTLAAKPIAVIAHLEYEDGESVDAHGYAEAWTDTAVYVRLTEPSVTRAWLPARDITRASQIPPTSNDS